MVASRDTLRVAATATEAPLGVFKLEYDISKDDATKSADWKEPVIVAVSGAAGQISNHLLFKIASGEVYGPDQPVALRLLGSERSREALGASPWSSEDSSSRSCARFPSASIPWMSSWMRIGRCSSAPSPEGRVWSARASSR